MNNKVFAQQDVFKGNLKIHCCLSWPSPNLRFLVQSLRLQNHPHFKVKTWGVNLNSWIRRPSHPPPLHLNIVPSCSHLWSFTANSIPLNELPFPHFIRAQHDPQIGPCKFSPIWLLLSLCQPVHNRSVRKGSRHRCLLWGSAEKRGLRRTRVGPV